MKIDRVGLSIGAGIDTLIIGSAWLAFGISARMILALTIALVVAVVAWLVITLRAYAAPTDARPPRLELPATTDGDGR